MFKGDYLKASFGICILAKDVKNMCLFLFDTIAEFDVDIVGFL